MKHTNGHAIYRIIVLICLIIISANIQADDKDVLNRKLNISKTKGTIYQLLKHVSDLSGYLFIYDSQLINNDQLVKIDKREYSLREIIYAITGNPTLRIDVLDNHILLRPPENKPSTKIVPAETDTKEARYITLTGSLYDRITGEPVMYATLGITSTSIGTISNQEGAFRLTVPDSLSSHPVKFSHIGYESKELQFSLLAQQNIRIYLDPRIIPLQEIVVRVVDPLQTISKMIDEKKNNYSKNPVYQTVFYREGIEYKKKNIDLTESVLLVHKGGYDETTSTDQAKLIKMRRIVNRHSTDTIFPKMKSGINSCFVLDIIKEFPEFIDLSETSPYLYTYTDVDIIDNKKVNVISFEQRPHIKQPLYKGELLIEDESNALIGANFEINKDFVGRATGLFVEKKNPRLKLSLQHAKYSVNYKPTNDGRYQINYIRGDIQFKVRKRGQLFNNTLQFWYEMVNCKSDTENVKTFPRNERLLPNKVFSETKHPYDENFWEHFNIILPEEELKDAIINSLNEVTILNE